MRNTKKPYQPKYHLPEETKRRISRGLSRYHRTGLTSRERAAESRSSRSARKSEPARSRA